MYDADAAKWWADLAGVDRAAFEKQAADLLALLAVLRQVAAGGVGLLSLVYTENLIRVDDVMESPKLAE